MRVTNYHGTRETEAFPALGRVTVLGGGILHASEFYATYRCEKERRDGERRQTWDRRKRQDAGRRHRGHSRRRLDHLTPAEREALMYGAHAVWMIEV